MSLLGTSNLTLADIAKRKDTDGSVARIIELLTQSNDVLDDIMWKPTNEETTELTSVRTALPSVFWRVLNSGTLPSKSTTAQLREACGLMDAWTHVDQKLAELSGDVAGVMLSESRAFIEAMRQEFVSTLIYGTAAAPEEFIGLATRYSALSGAGNSANVISASGSGSTNTSVWLISWDAETITGIYPKHSSAGLKHVDEGLVTIQAAGGVAGAFMKAYQSHFTWDAGVAVKDYRYAVRICNIETGTYAADLIDKMEQAVETIPNELGRKAFYMNRSTRRYLRALTRSDVSAGGGLTYENVNGRRVTMFGDIPVRITDALVNTEATVT